MAHPLMPRATAIWLVDNTTLSFVQIAEFCGLHELEVQAIADGEVAQSMVGVDPIQAGQLTREELERCSKDSTTRLTLVETSYGHKIASLKKERYTPRARRQDRPDAIAWILKHCPNLTDPQVVRLIGTTKPTINAIRTRTHWNMQNLKPQNPVVLGFCSQEDLDKVMEKAEGNKKAEGTKEGKKS